MLVVDWLVNTIEKLTSAGVDSPRRDALVLLEDSLNKDRAWVVTHPEFEIPQIKLQKINELIERRLNREPLAYIRGKAWFYGRFFNVSPDVMIPRPESESFIELMKQIMSENVKGLSFHVVEVGTGSGCLAVTVKLEFPTAEVIAIDNSEKALLIAKENAQKHKVKIQFLKGDLLAPLRNRKSEIRSTVLMANLPYVPENLITSPEITQEPAEALFSGKDGLDHYRKFWRQVSNLDIKPSFIMTESLRNQHEELKVLAKQSGYNFHQTSVLVQLFKTM